MPNQFWSAPLNFGPPWSNTSGTSLTTSSAVSIITPGFPGSIPDFQLPAYYWYPGKQMRLTLAGVWTSASTPGTWTTRFSVGTPAAPVVTATPFLNSGAVTLTASVTTGMWRGEALMRCRSYASSTNANVLSIGELKFYSGTLSTSSLWVLPWGQSGITAPADVSIPNSTAQYVFADMAFSNTNANTVQVHHYMLEDVT